MILHFFKKCLCYQHFLCHSCLSFHYTLQFRLLLILFSSSCFFNKPVVYFFMSVLADIMIIHQLRETIFMRSLHLISSKVFHTSMDSKKVLSLRTEPYALFALTSLIITSIPAAQKSIAPTIYTFVFCSKPK